MRTLRFLLQKEFKQIFRNKAILPIIFLAPILQLLILPLAADYEIKNINLFVVDQDRSSASKGLISSISNSEYFILYGYGSSMREALGAIEGEKADLVLEIPHGFERTLVREQKGDLHLAINAINGVKANMGGAYLSQIIQSYAAGIQMHGMDLKAFPESGFIDILPSFWYNPNFDYSFFMVPGILVILVTMVGAYLCALNIVKEKEVGTIEQINVTPIKKSHFILGKLLPFLFIGLIVFSIGLFLVGYGVYGIRVEGSLGLLYGYLVLFLLAILGLGLLISTLAQTQ